MGLEAGAVLVGSFLRGKATSRVQFHQELEIHTVGSETSAF